MVVDQITTALEQMADSVIITNREGIIEYVNRAFEALSGFSRQECIGRKTSLLRSGVQAPRFYTTMWSTILSGRPFHMVVTNRRHDGALFEHEQTITPIRDGDGAITHFVSTGREVTARKRTRAARLHHRLEYEARRVAGVLHADTGQYLALAHMTLAEVGRDVPTALAERLQEARQYLDRVEQRLLRASQGAHSTILGDQGLAAAIRLAADNCARRTGMKIHLESTLPFRCPAATETLIYRIIQETLDQLSRHGGSRRVCIELAREVVGRRVSDETVRCSVRVDRERFEAPALDVDSGGSSGLRALRERLVAIGGSLTVNASADGTELRALVPLER
jgi:PAS domain S-box-containing protein